MVGVAVLEVGVGVTAVETARVINKKQSQYIVDVWGRTV